MARRKLKAARKEHDLVEYADQEPSAFSSMLGGLIEANVKSRPEKEIDFETLVARVGIAVKDIGESVTLEFKGGHLVVHNGLKPRRTITIHADAETVMSLSNLKIGPLGLPIYVDEVGRGIAMKLLRGSHKIDGLLPNIFALNAVTRIFSVQCSRGESTTWAWRCLTWTSPSRCISECSAASWCIGRRANMKVWKPRSSVPATARSS